MDIDSLNTVLVTDLFGTQHLAFKMDLLNYNRDSIRTQQRDTKQFGTIHRNNIINRGTIGFQIVDRFTNKMPHDSKVVITQCEAMNLLLAKSMLDDVDACWDIIQVKAGDVDNPVYIPSIAPSVNRNFE